MPMYCSTTPSRACASCRASSAARCCRPQRNRLHGLGIWHDGPGYVFVRASGKTPTWPARRSALPLPAPLEAGIRAANGIPVSLPAPDVYVSLQQGLIEGVVSAITFAAPSRWYEVVKAGPA